jgi:imidazolonepropionase-like amidohydrolase
VRTLEHANLIDEDAAALAADGGRLHGPEPDLLRQQGLELGYTPEAMAKLSDVAGAGARSLEIAARAGLKIA